MKCEHNELFELGLEGLRALRWMSKEPAEIFERAAEDGFIQQV